MNKTAVEFAKDHDVNATLELISMEFKSIEGESNEFSSRLDSLRAALSKAEQLVKSGDKFFKLEFTLVNARTETPFIVASRFDEDVIDAFENDDAIAFSMMFAHVSGFDEDTEINDEGEIWTSDDEMINAWHLTPISAIDYAILEPDCVI
ncbi:hypothetical protein [Vibrio owensii]|uniref:hypothetical protein n=1 Tax=Vibrio harveyi group TaxID=717610 RepID=UPI003CC5BB75